MLPASGAVSKEQLQKLIFSCFAALNALFFVSFLLRTLGLPYFVLFSPVLDWILWAVSGNIFGWICITLARSERWALYLGLSALIGSVLQVLPVLSPGQFEDISGYGGFLVFGAVLVTTIIATAKAQEVFRVSRREMIGELLSFFFALVIPLQIWSISTMLPFQRPWKVYPQFRVFMAYDRLLLLLLPFTSLVFTLLVTQWLWLPVAAKAVGCRVRIRPLDGMVGKLSRRDASFSSRFLTGFAVLIGAFVAGFQWLIGTPLGQDSRYYTSVLRLMETAGISAAFSTERPFLFLVLYPIEIVLGLEHTLLLRLLTILLAVLCVVVTYRFVRYMINSEEIAAFAALFAAVSPHVIVGVEIFIAANWLGIVLMILLFHSYLKSMRERSDQWRLITIVISGLTLGFHYFTWVFSALVLLTHFLALFVRKHRIDRDHVRFCGVLVLGCVAISFPAVLIAYMVGGGASESLRLALRMVTGFLFRATPMNFFDFLGSSDRVYNYLGREHYAAPLVYTLALVGFAQIARSDDDGLRVLKWWFVASCVGVLVVQHNEWWRFLYMLPLEILAGIGLAIVVTLVGWGNAINVRKDALWVTGLELAIFVVFGILLAYSAMSSFVLLVCLGLTALIQLHFRHSSWIGAKLLLVVSLVLEETTRALYALA